MCSSVDAVSLAECAAAAMARGGEVRGGERKEKSYSRKVQNEIFIQTDDFSAGFIHLKKRLCRLTASPAVLYFVQWHPCILCIFLY